MTQCARAPIGSTWTLLFAAWLVAMAGTLGALFIGEVMGQAPCSLCWYQRIFMFPLAVLLGIACYAGDRRAGRYALPLAGLGWLAAAYHLLVYAGIVPAEIVRCGEGPACDDSAMTLFAVVPIPLLSLIAFSAIALLLYLALKGPSHEPA